MKSSKKFSRSLLISAGAAGIFFAPVGYVFADEIFAAEVTGKKPWEVSEETSGAEKKDDVDTSVNYDDTARILAEGEALGVWRTWFASRMMLFSAPAQPTFPAGLPVLNSTTNNKYIAADAAYILTQSGFEGDAGASIASIVNGGTAWNIYGGNNAANFAGSIWLTLDSATVNTGTGAKNLYGGGNGKNVDGSVNIMLDGFVQTGGAFNIYGSGTGAHNVGGDGNPKDVNIILKNGSTAGTVYGANTGGTVWGNVNISLLDGSSATGNVYGAAANSTVKQNVYVTVEGDAVNRTNFVNDVGGAIAVSGTTTVGGDVNVAVSNVNFAPATKGVWGAYAAANTTATVTGDINVTLSTVTGGGVVNGATTGNAGTSKLSIGGNLTVDISDSAVGAVTLTSAPSTGTGVNTVGGDVSLTVSSSTAGVITGGGATVTGDVDISLNGVNSGGTGAAVTGSTGSVSGNVTVDIANNSKTAAIIGTSGTVAKNVGIGLTGSTSTTIIGASGSVSGDILVTLINSNATTVDIHSGATKTLDGDLTLNVYGNSTTGAITGIKTNTSGTSGKISINIDGSNDGTGTGKLTDVTATTGAITATGAVAPATNTAGKGISVDIKNATVTGAISGGAATVESGGVSILLNNTNRTTGQAVTGSTGSVTGGVAVTLINSKATTVYAHNAAGMTLSGDVTISLLGSTTTGNVLGFNGASGTTGKVTINVDGSNGGAASGNTVTGIITATNATIAAANKAEGGIEIQLKDATTGAISGGAATVSSGNVVVSLDNTNTTTGQAVTGSSGTVAGNVGIGITNNSKAAAVVGSSGNVSGDIAITLMNASATTVDVHSGASKTLGSDLTLNVYGNSTTGAITGIKTNTTGTSGKISISIDGTNDGTGTGKIAGGMATIGAITATGAVAPATNTAGKGISVDIKNATVTGAISGGGATVADGDVIISLNNVNTTATAQAVTGSTGSVTGDVTVGIMNSKAAIVSGSTGSVTGNVTVGIRNSTTGSVYGYNGANGVVGGNVTVNIDTDSAVTGNIAGVYTTAAATPSLISGAVAVNINGVAGTNVFGANFASTIFGGYYNATGNKAYGTLNFKNYVGDFKGVIGSATLGQTTAGGGFSQVNIDANSSVNFTRTAATSYYADTIWLGSDVSFNMGSVASAAAFKLLKASDAMQNSDLTGSGDITFTAANAGSSLELGGNSAAYTGTIDVDNAKLTLGANSVFGASTIDISGGTLTVGAGATFNGTTILAGSSTVSLTSASFTDANITLTGTTLFTVTPTVSFTSSTLNLASTSTLVLGGVGDMSLDGLAVSGAGSIKTSGSGIKSLNDDMSGFSGNYIILHNTDNALLSLNGAFASTLNVGMSEPAFYGDSRSNVGLVLDGTPTSEITTINFLNGAGGRVYANGNKFAIQKNGTVFGTVVAYGMDGTTIGAVNGSFSGHNLNSDYSLTAGSGAKLWVIAPGVTVNGDVTASLSNSNIGFAAVANWSTINGNVNFTVTDSTLTQSFFGSQSTHQSQSGAILGMGTTIAGDINAVYKNVTALGDSNGNYAMIHMANPGNNPNGIGITVTGNVNLTISGGTYRCFRVGPNHGTVSDYESGQFGTIKGSVNAVIGAVKNADGTYTVDIGSNVPVFSGNSNTYLIIPRYESILATGGSSGIIESDVNLAIYSGTFGGSIAMGPNSQYVGGSTNLNIYGGTFGEIYAGSHNAYSSRNAGIVKGSANFNVSAGEYDTNIVFNQNIYVGASSTAYGGSYANQVLGDAIATFTGDLSRVSFSGTRTVYGGEANGQKKFNFTDATGGFAATISGFNRLNIANSDLVGTIKLTSTPATYISGTSSLDGSIGGTSTNTAEVTAGSTFNLHVGGQNQITGKLTNNSYVILTPKNNLAAGTSYQIASNSFIDGVGSKIRVEGAATYTNNFLTAGATRSLISTEITNFGYVIIGTATTLTITDDSPVVAGDTSTLRVTTHEGQNIKLYSAHVADYTDAGYTAGIDLSGGKEILTAWTLSVLTGETDLGINSILSFGVGDGLDLSSISMWSKIDDIWTNQTASLDDLAYANGYLSFTTENLNDWAIVIPGIVIPEPSTYALWSTLALVGIAAMRRKKNRVSGARSVHII